MSAMGAMTARQWAQIFGLGLAVAAAIVVAVAIVLPAAALALAAALTVAALTVAAQRASALARAARAAVSGAPTPEAMAQPTLRLELADGAVVNARPVPLPGESEHTLLLTRDGYVVVSAEGKVLHRL
jgi:hypothetical protein